MTSTIDITDALTAVPDGYDIRDVEQFLYREARYLDDRDFEQWLECYAPDAEFWMPS